MRMLSVPPVVKAPQQSDVPLYMEITMAITFRVTVRLEVTALVGVTVTVVVKVLLCKQMNNHTFAGNSRITH